MSQAIDRAESPTPLRDLKADLTDLLFGAVIPHLAQARETKWEPTSRQAVSTGPGGRLGVAGASDDQLVLALCTVCLQGNVQKTMAFIDEIRSKGLGIERIFTELLQPAARHLGARWHNDECDFVDVTTGVWQLQQAFQRLRPELEPAPSRTLVGGENPRLLLSAMPCSQHTFGIKMLEPFFQREGWITTIIAPRNPEAMCASARRVMPDLIGLSLGCEKDIIQAPTQIEMLRIACADFDPAIMIGGPATTCFPELARSCGADLISGDAQDATRQAGDLLKTRPLRV